MGTIETYLDGKLIKRDNLISSEKINKISFIDKFLMLIYK